MMETPIPPLTGVYPILLLLPSGLLTIIGSNITALNCARFHKVMTDAEGNSQVINKPCGPNCAMFGPPFIYEKNVRIDICDHKRIEARRLIDLTGEIVDIDIETATVDELFVWLKERGVISVNQSSPNAQPTENNTTP